MTRPHTTPDILLVEDNPGDVRLTEEAFREAEFEVDLHIATTGTEAIEFVKNEECPLLDFVLLDLNLPRKDGFDVLEEIRDDQESQRLPVLVLTGSTATEDVISSYQQHANAYLTKPDSSELFGEVAQAIEDFWLETAQLPPSS